MTLMTTFWWYLHTKVVAGTTEVVAEIIFLMAQDRLNLRQQ